MRSCLLLLLIIIPAILQAQLPFAIKMNTDDSAFSVPDLPKEYVPEIYHCWPIETEAVPDTGWRSYLLGISPLDDSAPGLIQPGAYRVMIAIAIGKDGCISMSKCMEDSSSYGLGARAAAIIAMYTGRWTPATQNGRPVKAYRRLPLVFIIDEPEEDCPGLPLLALTHKPFISAASK